VIGRYLLRRALGIALTLLVVATVTFALTVLIPADPARTIVGPKATPEQVALVRQQLGLDDPLPVQYGRYLADLARLDLGYSYAYQREVRAILADRIPFTVALAAAALVVQLGIGVPVGLLSAARADGPGDRLALGWTMVTIALPGFWIGLVLLYLFAFRWPLFPLGGPTRRARWRCRRWRWGCRGPPGTRASSATRRWKRCTASSSGHCARAGCRPG
jgi:peptide/nickel transport system permease protein